MEAVRLVVWDLDETFWRGTVTEGGIREYVQQHHDMIIELNRRGIMCSICSKNDFETVKAILVERGIWDYFIFPSISWEPKGLRIARLIEDVQLRAPTVLFLDDNPNNRAEAAALVPGLQVEDEHFVAGLLADPRFKGKDDAGLSRLKQYKLLETRKADEARATGGNEEFLRQSGIRVFIDYDVAGNIDRVVELINRTNQLNFTKNRLPEDAGLARAHILQKLSRFDCHAGLVRVEDKYGDYGHVGFFMVRNGRKRMVPGAAATHLAHFCFSCRTLGMEVERWVYDFLGRPELVVVGEVLTDLSVDRRIDWIRQVNAPGEGREEMPAIASRLIAWGGCEIHSIAGYLGAAAPTVISRGNYAASGLFARAGFSQLVLDGPSRAAPGFAEEVATLGLDVEHEMLDVFANPGPNDLYVFNLTGDMNWLLRHRTGGWHFSMDPRGWKHPKRFFEVDAEELDAVVAAMPGEEQEREHLRKVGRHVALNYERVPVSPTAEILRRHHRIVEAMPAGSRCIFLLDLDCWRLSMESTAFKPLPRVADYSSRMRREMQGIPHVGLVEFADAIRSDEEVKPARHYAREVYYRLSQLIAAKAAALTPKASPLESPAAREAA
ncbi:HAD-IIIC family phosphatase [Roseomonas stagni]|uniref:HAD-IIIC family phosphatase n=1 Tax=Falsiroseomonas algicola TaxID=2716930 RepID=A0A6M1LSL4_9PROT|nr:HAD-IIIC family phosphatase [Falsiroseomonas algicola]NGM23450.1 HAD-IIIC family phosphatase [Falsiroseomonas algicola]